MNIIWQSGVKEFGLGLPLLEKVEQCELPFITSLHYKRSSQGGADDRYLWKRRNRLSFQAGQEGIPRAD